MTDSSLGSHAWARSPCDDLRGRMPMHPGLAQYRDFFPKHDYVFVAVEDVAPDARTLSITAGALRASLCQLAEPPSDHPHPGPYHPCDAASQRHLVPTHPAMLSIVLHPTSWLIRPGDCLRLALAGADRDHLARVSWDRSPLLQVLRGGAHPPPLAVPSIPHCQDKPAARP